eukprot:CAMPEP_0206264430 /NCGR_PEP_ID=MMETSP0047_2-20121206/29398_1 /ASSEMBLY_ACC=CAM_ASM_000192 /TAXON_ID=195065 /ORGANISM="Chroomonas mesostigmatica_cf, Strain CCMP1168" /LENGTH=95 /DNA_ID=CAMNT_0053692139 /DNA_START=80 /DNA_END=363 /DNA_ORIENTATION=+
MSRRTLLLLAVAAALPTVLAAADGAAFSAPLRPPHLTAAIAVRPNTSPLRPQGLRLGGLAGVGCGGGTHGKGRIGIRTACMGLAAEGDVAELDTA